jgi:hypothetical protein
MDKYGNAPSIKKNLSVNTYIQGERHSLHYAVTLWIDFDATNWQNNLQWQHLCKPSNVVQIFTCSWLKTKMMLIFIHYPGGEARALLSAKPGTCCGVCNLDVPSVNKYHFPLSVPPGERMIAPWELRKSTHYEIPSLPSILQATFEVINMGGINRHQRQWSVSKNGRR